LHLEKLADLQCALSVKALSIPRTLSCVHKSRAQKHMKSKNLPKTFRNDLRGAQTYIRAQNARSIKPQKTRAKTLSMYVQKLSRVDAATQPGAKSRIG
jgi:hypothetical protein